MTLRGFHKLLNDMGVNQIGIIPGETLFDYRIHDAISIVPGENKAVVKEILKNGYNMIDSKNKEINLIPAKVIVSGKTYTN